MKYAAGESDGGRALRCWVEVEHGVHRAGMEDSLGIRIAGGIGFCEGSNAFNHGEDDRYFGGVGAS